MTFENVGEKFNEQELSSAQEKAWRLLHDLAGKMKPGMKEGEAYTFAKELFAEYGAEKKWHPTKIRFGKNTLKTFRELSDPDVVLQENDILFLDLGPVFFGHEADVGKTFVLGTDPEAQKLISAGESIFQKVSEHWQKTGESGEYLYEYAQNLARDWGYELETGGGSGHRISDFPHAIHHKGTLRSFSQTPQSCRWILEIQLRDFAHDRGAFFEDILKSV
jgi:Xaa-Pro aminopeptidase